MIKPEKGRILISEPFLQDPNFNRTVVLITEHTNDGSVGFVLNHSTDVEVKMIMPELEVVEGFIFEGGPVEQDSLHFIHTYPGIPGSSDLGNGIFWSGDFEHVLDGIKEGIYVSSQFRFFVGYSGWSVGQLDDEIEDEAWVVSEILKEDLFTETIDDNALWKNAMTRLGGDFAILANSPINPHLN